MAKINAQFVSGDKLIIHSVDQDTNMAWCTYETNRKAVSNHIDCRDILQPIVDLDEEKTFSGAKWGVKTGK